MELSIPNLLMLAFLLPTLPTLLPPAQASTTLFRAYIGADFKDVKFTDVPVNPSVDFHFILSFAIDYTTATPTPAPTNGKFSPYWDTGNLSPSQVASIKKSRPNVRVAMSLGGDSIGNDRKVFFTPTTINSWVSNAVTSITQIVREYHVDGIDVDYEHFNADPDTFAECIGRLLTILKRTEVVSFASIAPYDDREVQSHYSALWGKYGSVIDYVNFQFYAYDRGTSAAQLVGYLETQRRNYVGGKVLVSYISDGSGGLAPGREFFGMCRRLRARGELDGIFVWSADDSKARGFQFERQSQALLTGG